jgi:hypothetical protein
VESARLHILARASISACYQFVQAEPDVPFSRLFSSFSPQEHRTLKELMRQQEKLPGLPAPTDETARRLVEDSLLQNLGAVLFDALTEDNRAGNREAQALFIRCTTDLSPQEGMANFLYITRGMDWQAAGNSQLDIVGWSLKANRENFADKFVLALKPDAILHRFGYTVTATGRTVVQDVVRYFQAKLEANVDPWKAWAG